MYLPVHNYTAIYLAHSNAYFTKMCILHDPEFTKMANPHNLL